MSNYPDGVTAFDIPGWDDKDEDFEEIELSDEERELREYEERLRLTARIEKDFPDRNANIHPTFVGILNNFIK